MRVDLDPEEASRNTGRFSVALHKLCERERPHQSLDNQLPQEVHKTSSVGGAMFVGKYRSKERLPVALRSRGTAAGEVRIEIKPAIQKAKTGAAPTSCEKLSAT
jgi:hypothetical protein